jgi:flagellar biosynthesis GTPase FlhF
MSTSNQPNGEFGNSKSPRPVFGAKRRAEPDPDGGAIAEAMRRTEAALVKIPHSPPVAEGADASTDDKQSDPAPSPQAIAEERAQQLIANISSQMLGELRSLREQIDDLMRDMNERRQLIREAIRSHAEFAETAIQHKIIIAESVAKLRAEFEASRTPLPPVRTI